MDKIKDTDLYETTISVGSLVSLKDKEFKDNFSINYERYD